MEVPALLFASSPSVCRERLEGHCRAGGGDTALLDWRRAPGEGTEQRGGVSQESSGAPGCRPQEPSSLFLPFFPGTIEPPQCKEISTGVSLNLDGDGK